MKNSYEVQGDVTAIIIQSGKYGIQRALISTNKLDRAKEFPNKWHVVMDKASNSLYVRGNAPRRRGCAVKNVPLHRWLTNAPSGMVVDHINHNTLDNTDANLRICTQAENVQNKSGLYSNNKSGVRGVIWRKDSQKWTAQIKIERKQVHLGYFNTIEEAQSARLKAAEKHMPYSQEALAK